MPGPRTSDAAEVVPSLQPVYRLAVVAPAGHPFPHRLKRSPSRRRVAFQACHPLQHVEAVRPPDEKFLRQDRIPRREPRTGMCDDQSVRVFERVGPVVDLEEVDSAVRMALVSRRRPPHWPRRRA